MFINKLKTYAMDVVLAIKITSFAELIGGSSGFLCKLALVNSRYAVPPIHSMTREFTM